MLPSFCRDIVTIHRPARKESRGSVVLDWSQESTHLVMGCSVQPGSTAHTMDDRTLAIQDGATLYAPNGADVAEGDRVEFDGIIYEVDGAPRHHRSATGRVSHVEVPLKNWRG